MKNLTVPTGDTNPRGHTMRTETFNQWLISRYTHSAGPVGDLARRLMQERKAA